MNLEQILSLLRTLMLGAMVAAVWHLGENQQLTIHAVSRMADILMQVEEVPADGLPDEAP